MSPEIRARIECSDRDRQRSPLLHRRTFVAGLAAAISAPIFASGCAHSQRSPSIKENYGRHNHNRDRRETARRAGFGHWLGLVVDIQAGANNDFPVAVALAIVQDPKLFASLAEIDARTFFARRDQLLLDRPEEGGLTHKWEWVGKMQREINLRLPERMAGALIFANYFEGGPHRAKIPAAPAVHLRCRAQDIQVRPLRERTDYDTIGPPRP